MVENMFSSHTKYSSVEALAKSQWEESISWRLALAPPTFDSLQLGGFLSTR